MDTLSTENAAFLSSDTIARRRIIISPSEKQLVSSHASASSASGRRLGYVSPSPAYAARHSAVEKNSYKKNELTSTKKPISYLFFTCKSSKRRRHRGRSFIETHFQIVFVCCCFLPCGFLLLSLLHKPPLPISKALASHSAAAANTNVAPVQVADE